MTSTEINAYLASQGIQATSLSPDVKQALFVILQGTGKAAVEQFTKLIQIEAAKRGLDTLSTESPATRAAKEQAAAKAALDAQAAATKVRQRRILLASIAGGFVALIVGIWLYVRHHKRNNG